MNILDKSDTTASKAAPSAYATGGGGTILEHRYAGLVLASLLLEAPIPGLGDDFAVEEVRFQASVECALDDLLVTGISRRGALVVNRRLAIGIRRDPTIGPSDVKFVKLLGDCLGTVQRYRSDVDIDAFRLAIVVAAPHPGAQELSEVALHARSFGAALEFEQSFNARGRVRRQLKDRLRLFKEALGHSAPSTVEPLDTTELAWRLLRSLWIEQCQLEEVSTDRTNCVRQLQALLPNATEADALLDYLYVMAGEFAQAGGTVSRASLRRRLVGKFRLGRSRGLTTTWLVLDSLAESLRNRTQNQMEPRTGASRSVRIDRAAARTELVTTVSEAAASSGLLIVAGEPGVGKSALALDVLTELSQQGQAALTMMSLRDIGGMSAIQLEHTLGLPLADALGATAVAPFRLLLLDGAEVVQEGVDRTFGDVVRAASAAGLTVIAVTRRDAEDNVASLLSSSTNKPLNAIYRHIIEGFTEKETDVLVAQLPQLERLTRHSGSRWLLSRPGLLKLVLEDDVLKRLPDGPLCEAVVYLVIWRNLVRRSEQLAPDRATPDGRDAVVRSIARRLLFSDRDSGANYPDPYALPSLRSDGVLLPAPKGLVWQTGEEFASDLLRDIAVTQLLVREPQLLVDAKAPRWILHATRVFLQALLIQEKGGRDPLATLTGQLAFCQKLAQQHGARWADLPWEAVLTGSDPSSLLEAEWAFLHGNGGQPLHDLLRVLISRFSNLGQLNADIGNTVIHLLCDHYQDVTIFQADLLRAIEKLILYWLRSMASRKSADINEPLRTRVRDLFLFNHQYQHDEWCVECLGLLGPDLNGEAEQRLRSLAQTRPEHLHPCLEEVLAPWSLSVHHPELLLDLAKSYYIELPKEDEHQWARSHSPWDKGVRHHRTSGIGPSAAWYYGPFYALLHSKVAGKTITFINQLMDHAARIRVAQAIETGIPSYLDEEGVDIGIEVEIPGIGNRKFMGDSHVWRWYRGSGAGPYPCMSALMALEAVVDKFLEADVPLRELSMRLLSEANSLAMAGFVYGMIARQAQQDTNLLDPWLVRPEVWRLENARTMHDQTERSFADSALVKNADRRLLDPLTISYLLTAKAIATQDNVAIKRLAAVGDRLVENGCQISEKQAEDVSVSSRQPHSRRFHDLLTIRRWAGSLVASNYKFRKSGDDILLEYVPPADVTQKIAERSQDFLRGQQLYQIQHRYCDKPSSAPVNPEQVRKDLADIVPLLEQAPESGPPFRLIAPAALALNAIKMHNAGELILDVNELLLVVVISIKSAESEFPCSTVEDVSFLPWGADRSAAHALPLILLPSFDLSSFEPESVQEAHQLTIQALGQLAQSPVVEARSELVDGLRSIWAAPCGSRPEASGACVHRIALDVILAAARHCRVKAGGFSEIEPIPEPFDQSIQAIDPNDLLLSRVATTVAILGDAAGSGCCVATDAFRLLPACTTVYGTVAALGNGHGHLVVEDIQDLVAGGLLRTLLTYDAVPLLHLLDSVSQNHPVATQLLHSLCRVASYGQREREALAAVWPRLMVRMLDTVERPTPGERREDSYTRVQLLASLLPRPRPRRDERAIDALLKEAGTNWLHPKLVAPLMERWTHQASGSPECAEAIAWFMQYHPIDERLQFGLPWIERVIGAHFRWISKRTRVLVPWLTEMMAKPDLDENLHCRLRCIIDGLAACEDPQALAAQRQEEAPHRQAT